MHERKSNSRSWPGDTAIWIFIGMELATFLLFFLLFVLAWRADPELFRAGAAELHVGSGLANTIILLCGGWLAAWATQDNRLTATRRSLLLRLAAASGLLFAIVKAWDWAQLGAAGYHLSTDRFFTYYYFLTFVHFAHVLLAIAYLLVAAARHKQEDFTRSIESAASYWHMVDLVWIVLFPLVYLLPQGGVA
jgi:nitric oxide reductase NorE protein